MDDAGKIVKRVRTKAQQKETELIKKAANGDLEAARELLESWS